MKKQRLLALAVTAALAIPSFAHSLQAQTLTPIPAFPLQQLEPSISRPIQPSQPFTVAGPRGVLVGTQDGQFESWILPIKLLSHLTIEASIEGYSVPIPVNLQAAQIEVHPDHTTITYSHPGFTLRQIMFSPRNTATAPGTGPICLFQIDAVAPLDLTFRFTPEMRWMWPKRNEGIPSPQWIQTPTNRVPQVSRPSLLDGRLGISESPSGYYVLHLDYPNLAGAITIPTATPGILAPYQERPQVHPLELHLHYDPKRDGTGPTARLFPLLMAVGTTPETATAQALGQTLAQLNASIASSYPSHAAQYQKLLTESTTIETPDKSLNEAFQWGIISIEQLKAHEFASNQDALVAGYYASGDSARPGFGWFFGRDALYTLYAVNGFGDFALTHAELEFLIRRQRPDGKVMHEYAQTAADPTVGWPQFPYMYAAADATPLFLMAMRDYYRASGDIAFLQEHREAIEKAWAFETDPASDTDHDGIYDNSQGTGWVESWPGHMPHQEIYMALLDQQASSAMADLAKALGNPAQATTATTRAAAIQSKIESEYYDSQKGCYAFATNPPEPGKTTPNSPVDRTITIYPALAWWDYNSAASPLAHPEACLKQFASPALDTDWGTRDVANTEPYYDGMSYHQGSVWPLFTGWAALAEYRANQPLAGQQLLMQNADLTWAQDPGAVTELLSGDYFVPFGRSTSHQLWSSAMVITPTLRGLFGLSLDAATNTITVNPHLPAEWDHAEIHDLHLGDQKVDLMFYRDNSNLRIELRISRGKDNPNPKAFHLRSDAPGTQIIEHPRFSIAELSIPLPPVEIIPFSAHELPTPGARTGQIKYISTEYATHSLTITVAGRPCEESMLKLLRHKAALHLALAHATPTGTNTVSIAELSDMSPEAKKHETKKQEAKNQDLEPMYLRLHFPAGTDYQTLTFTLAW